MQLMPEGLTLIEQMQYIAVWVIFIGYGIVRQLWKVACFIAPFAIIWFVVKQTKNNKPKDKEPRE